VRSLRGIPSAYDRTNPQIPRRLRAEFPWRILCSLRADLALCGRLGCGLWQPLAATDCQGSYWSQRGPLARSSFLNRNSASQLHADLLAQLPGLGDIVAIQSKKRMIDFDGDCPGIPVCRIMPDAALAIDPCDIFLPNNPIDDGGGVKRWGADGFNATDKTLEMVRDIPLRCCSSCLSCPQ